MLAANRYTWNDLVRKTSGKLWHILTPSQISERFRKFSQMKYIQETGLEISKCHSDCFDSAFQELLIARKSIMAASAAQKKRTGTGFAYPDQLNFKSKKHGGGYVDIRPRHLIYNAEARTITINYATYFGDDKHFKIKTDLRKLGIDSFQYSCKLCKRNGRYYLLIPHNLVKKSPEPISKICSLDPGARTFLTGYDPSGASFELSNNQDHLLNKKRKIEALQSDLESVSSKRARRVIKKQIRNLYIKIKNCVSDLHHKSARILTDTYEEVIIPKFDTKRIVSDKKRKIGPETAYLLMTLSHYKFRMLLQHKLELQGRKLSLCTEEYTSMTCGACGRLNHGLEGDKIFSCPFSDCRMVTDRDVSAARNIYIKTR